MNFLERVLLTPVSENQLSSIVESFPSMPVISGNETLDAAIQEMMSSGYQDVAAMDGGELSAFCTLTAYLNFFEKRVKKWEIVEFGGILCW
jgi:hypothetical protein